MSKNPEHVAPVPSTFVPSSAQKVLDGNHEALSITFPWQQTRQGYEFWSHQYKTGLTDEGRAILQAWVDATRPGGKP